MANHRYRDILEKVQEDIRSGRYTPGQRLPSETELVRRYGASRMTVFRAMHELQTMGLVVRRVGSGTFVAQPSNSKSHVFGLLIPELGQTEIFEVICKGMMESQEALRHSLLWGNSASKENENEEVAEQLCHHYILKKGFRSILCAGRVLLGTDFGRITELSRRWTRLRSQSYFSTDAWSLIRDAANMISSESITGEHPIWPRNI